MEKHKEIISAIRLEDAYFCLNCEAITNCVDICPSCGHRGLWPVQNWIGRVTDGNSKYRGSALEKQVQTVEVLEKMKAPSWRNLGKLVWNYSPKT